MDCVSIPRKKDVDTVVKQTQKSLREAGSKILGHFRRRFYTERDFTYGPLDAILYPRDIDVWNRYARIATEIKKASAPSKNSVLILEVGSGPGTVLDFLKPPKYCFISLDMRRSAFIGRKLMAEMVVADGCKLPFKDKVFDIVLSIDTVEHIPKKIRHIFFEELKRSCREKLLLHLPLESSSGLFRGREYDIEFQKTHKKNLEWKIQERQIT